MCKVVHFKKDDYDIYIGRLPNNEYNKWAYPKTLRETFPDDTPRQMIIDAYEDYLLSKPDLMKDLVELKYKTLGCWCKNKGGKGKSCHGDILKKYVDKLEKLDQRKNLLNE